MYQVSRFVLHDIDNLFHISVSVQKSIALAYIVTQRKAIKMIAHSPAFLIFKLNFFSILTFINT